MLDWSEADAKARQGGFDFRKSNFAVDWFNPFEIRLIPEVEFAAIYSLALLSSRLVVRLEIDV